MKVIQKKEELTKSDFWKSKPLMIHTADLSKDWFKRNGFLTIKQQAEEVEDWHLKRGFSLVGYHYLINGSGIVETKRLKMKAAAHCKASGMNRKAIGLCVIGSGVEEKLLPEEIESIKIIFEVHQCTEIIFHCDYDNKTCPGSKVIESLEKSKLKKFIKRN